MPWYGFLHPALAIYTMVYGIITAQTSVRRLTDWDFPLRRQRTRSTVFFLLCVANMVLGFIVRIILRAGFRDVKLTFHVPLAITTIALALLASLVTFGQPKKPGELPGLMRLHPWLIVVAVVIIMTMGFLGLLSAFGI